MNESLVARSLEDRHELRHRFEVIGLGLLHHFRVLVLLIDVHHLLDSLQRTDVLHTIWNLLPVWTNTACHDVQMVVVSIMVKVHEYWLPLVVVAHLI